MIRLKHILKINLLVLGCGLGLLLCMPSPVASAETITCADNSVHDLSEIDANTDNVANLCASNGGIKPGATVQSSNVNDESCSSRGSSDQCIIFKKYLIPLIDVLTAGVGLIVTIMLVIGGVQYTASAGNAQTVAAAKQRMFNAMLALISFALLWAFLQWIVPGGIFQ